MIPIIETIIPHHKFEFARDRTALILLVELQNQGQLGIEELSGFDKVWIDRISPFEEEELPAVNVSLSSGDYSNETAKCSDGLYTFFIDAYTHAKETEDRSAEFLSCSQLDRIVGIIRAILKHPEYRNLRFDAPFLTRTTVTGFQKAQGNSQDAISTRAARIQFTVRVSEDVMLSEPIPIGSHYTTVTLSHTDKGYFWIYQKVISYVVSEDEKFIVSESGTARFVMEN